MCLKKVFNVVDVVAAFNALVSNHFFKCVVFVVANAVGCCHVWKLVVLVTFNTLVSYKFLKCVAVAVVIVSVASIAAGVATYEYYVVAVVLLIMLLLRYISENVMLLLLLLMLLHVTTYEN